LTHCAGVRRLAAVLVVVVEVFIVVVVGVGGWQWVWLWVVGGSGRWAGHSVNPNGRNFDRIESVLN